MPAVGRPLNKPVPGFYEYPTLGASPGVSPTNGARVYTDGVSLLASIAGAAYVALATLGGGTFTGAVTIDTSAAPAFSIDSDAVSGTIARIRHDVATTPSAALVGFQVDLATNWLAGNFRHTGVDIRIPATTVAAAAKVGALVIVSEATLQRVVDVSVQNTGGTLAYLRYNAATNLAAALTGLVIDLDDQVTAGTQLVTGLSVLIPGAAGTNASVGFSYARSGAPTAAGTYTGRAINIQNTPTGTNNCTESSSGLVLINHAPVAGAGTITDTTTGLAITMTPAASSAVKGISITMGTTASSSARALTITDNGSCAPTVLITKSGNVGNALTVSFGGEDAYTALDVLLASSTLSGGGPNGLLIRRETIYTASQTLTNPYIWINAIPVINGVGQTLTLNGTLIKINHAPTITAGTITDTTTGLAITMTPAASAAVKGISVIMAANTSNAGYAATFDWRSAAGTATGNGILNIEIGAATVFTGQVVGLEIDISANSTPGAVAHIGQRILIPATTRASTALEAALVISSTATRMRAVDCAVACTGAADGIWMLRWGTAATLSASTRAMTIDALTNVTGGTQLFEGLYVRTPAAITNASYAAKFEFNGTAGSSTGTIGILTVINTVASPTDEVIGIYVNLTANANAQATCGLSIGIGGVTAADGISNNSAIMVKSTATLQRIFDCTIANTASPGLWQLRWAQATSLTAAVTGVRLDLTTNVTPGANAAVGMYIDIPATTRANTALEAALVITTNATASRAIDVDIANTSGTPVVVRYGAATTPNAVVMMTLNLSTNVNTNTNANIGLDIPIVAADEDTTAPLRMNTMRFFVGTGAPVNANGTDGDEYHRIDGAALTSVYKRVAGVWAVIS